MEDSVFGIHYDCHVNETQKNVGSHADPEQIERMLQLVKPDFLHCDTKGHPGLSSYPTQVGTCGDLAGDVDLLKMWRKLTERNGVALYAHHSSLWDETAVREHPDWALVDENGVPSDKYVSMFGPYLKERFIPQVIEIATKYRLDGIWVDGDNWCVLMDYSKWAEKAYFEECGKPLPGHGDADYENYIAFTQREFKNYVKTYCDAIHAAAPDFQICSNHLGTGTLPDRDMPPVDFVSRDLTSIRDSVRLNVRLMQKTGRPWDMMSWFSEPGPVFDVSDLDDQYLVGKEIAQILQEAALGISMGGAYEYCNYAVDHIPEWAIPRYAATAEFCRARAPFCHHAKPVPQAAVFCSEKANYASIRIQNLAAKGDRAFPFEPDIPFATDMKAVLDLLLDNQYSTEVIFPNEVENKDLLRFGLIALPDMPDIEEAAKKSLLDYAYSGGRLLLTGPQTLKLFAADLGITVKPGPEKTPYLELDEAPAGILTDFCEVSGNFRQVAKLYTDYFLKGESHTAVFEMPFGKGTIMGITVDFAAYIKYPVARVRRFFGEMVRHLWPAPAVTVTGSSFVEVILMEKDEMRCINLINTCGGYSGFFNGTACLTVDEIPPLYDLHIALTCDARPDEVYFEPGHQPAEYTYEDGRIYLTVPRLDIHMVIVVRERK